MTARLVDWLTRCGSKCDVCGFEVHAPAMWIVDVLFWAHDVWASLPGWHRRLGVLWDDAYARGVILALPWRRDAA